MPRRKAPVEEWIELSEAVSLMTAKYNRPIAPGFITRLAMDGKVETKVKDRRTKLYLKSDIEGYNIKTRKKVDVAQPGSVEVTPGC